MADSVTSTFSETDTSNNYTNIVIFVLIILFVLLINNVIIYFIYDKVKASIIDYCEEKSEQKLRAYKLKSKSKSKSSNKSPSSVTSNIKSSSV